MFLQTDNRNEDSNDVNNFQRQSLEVFYRKGVFKNFAKFTGKHLCQSLFFDKVAGLQLTTLLKRDFGTGVFL